MTLKVEISILLSSGVFDLEHIRTGSMFPNSKYRPNELFLDDITGDIFYFDNISGELIFSSIKDTLRVDLLEEEFKEILDFIISKDQEIAIKTDVDLVNSWVFKLHPLYGSDTKKVIYSSLGWRLSNGTRRLPGIQPEELKPGDPEWFISYINFWESVTELRWANNEEINLFNSEPPIERYEEAPF